MIQNPRSRQIADISDALGPRKLAWFGIRGHDAATLLSIPQFTECYAVTAPLRAGKLETAMTIEELTNERVDLDSYDIDFDTRPEVTELRRTMLARMRHPSAVATYRPSHFLDAICFASQDTTEYLGMFKGLQNAFEHKPWVETQLAARGIRTIPWRYVADEHRDSIRSEIERQPLILRASTRSGGVGIALVQDPDDLESAWPREAEHFVGVAPYLADAIPLNVGACVFDGDTVTVHPGSVQLVGVPGLTNRPFGYCGNDFAAFAHLDEATVRSINTSTIEIGKWLAEKGYRGAFGVDFLLDDDGIHFAEINARLQGSTSLGSMLAAEGDRTDIVLDHVAAFLGLAPHESPSLTDWVDDLPPAAHVVVHNTSDHGMTLGAAIPPVGLSSDARTEIMPNDDIVVDPGAIMFRTVFNRQITSSGFDIDRPALRAIDGVRSVWETCN